MDPSEGQRKFEALLARDPRYPAEAYTVVRDAIRLAQERHTQPSASLRHVTALQLLEALRDLTKRRCGGDARDYLKMIGIQSSDDVGEIVFSLIEIGAMAKTEKDSREDFANSFDFEREFHDSGSRIWVNAWFAVVVIAVVLLIVLARRDLFRAF